MEGFKEFLGKTLDAAIEDACTYYNASREKLEIEIVQDAKSGIFGIVGARKAKVRARRVALREVVESALGRGSRREENRAEAAPAETRQEDRKDERKDERRSGERGARRAQAAPGDKKPREDNTSRSAARGEPPDTHDADDPRRREERGARQPRKAIAARAETFLPARQEQTNADGEQPDAPAEAAPTARSPRGGGKSRDERPRSEDRTGAHDVPRDDRRQSPDDELDEAEEGLPRRAVEELDQEALTRLARECVSRLVRPVADGMEDAPDVSIVDGRVRVAVDCGEDSGLLIGREGQTLAALQYLASRIVSRGMNAAVRVQLDAGRYRQRPEEKLRDMALTLAAKVRQTGRSYSTRPLSSYHRRIIHVCLQEMEDILTRSSGDGPLKRVVIMRRRPEKGERPGQTERPSSRRGAQGRPAADRETPTTAMPAAEAPLAASRPAADAPIMAAPDAPIMDASASCSAPEADAAAPTAAPAEAAAGAEAPQGKDEA